MKDDLCKCALCTHLTADMLLLFYSTIPRYDVKPRVCSLDIMERRSGWG